MGAFCGSSKSKHSTASAPSFLALTSEARRVFDPFGLIARPRYESPRLIGSFWTAEQVSITVEYNDRVARPAASGGPKKNADRPSAPHKWSENIGLIVIAILILVIAITRYLRNIHWSTR